MANAIRILLDTAEKKRLEGPQLQI
ncbi:hypothetical protein CCACVL1_21770 [Corchorus capsularis]|uniref:Uncharacterized protein n=1 Tax=Corchorus capsularis TaxID=210143 RepID=A0A1R3H236_COCAP|nr:hypothetical protein CCACVL1_21770 [Corchorus capsularis]